MLLNLSEKTALIADVTEALKVDTQNVKLQTLCNHNFQTNKEKKEKKELTHILIEN